MFPAPTPSDPVGAPAMPDDGDISLGEILDLMLDNLRLLIGVTVSVFALGLGYAFTATPTYEANLLVQVEDQAGSPKGILGEVGSLFDVKTPASAEMEIIRSRMVLGKVVDTLGLNIVASPNYLPVLGAWLARRSTDLSEPGFLGFPGYVTGRESIRVRSFEAPDSADGDQFVVVADGQGGYELRSEELARPVKGKVGELLEVPMAGGVASLIISQLEGRKGAEFRLVRQSRISTIQGLQGALQISEKGRQSGIISVSLQGGSRARVSAILNEIGRQYVRQNIERKSEEAEKTLVFLDRQLPAFKRQLEESEGAFNEYRNRVGSIDLDEEGKLTLQQAVVAETRLLEAQQKKRELDARYSSEHPQVRVLNEQIETYRQQISDINGRIKKLPKVQQEAVRLTRDVKVNTELYQALLNNSLQLRLVKEGKVGNVRLLDEAAGPEYPVAPVRWRIGLVSLVVGLILGVIAVFLKRSLFGRITETAEIEQALGVSVFASIPFSDAQYRLATEVKGKRGGLHLLAIKEPGDPAIESLRSLRTALQFGILGAENNVVLMTGATPGVGKTFISVNFAALMGGGGKRVLLIDADLRRGHTHRYFGLQRGTGLAEVILSPGLARTGVVRDTDADHVSLVTTGTLPPNPAELLMSDGFRNFVREQSALYDMVIIDAPPVLVAADTAAIAAVAGAVFFVVRADQSILGDVIESAKRLRQAGRRVDGVLFNGVDLSRRRYGYGYGYKYSRYRYHHYKYDSDR